MLSQKIIEERALFQPPDGEGINGVDGLHSKLMPDGRCLMVFGDSLFGEIKDRQRVDPLMYRNSLAIKAADGEVTYFTGPSDQPVIIDRPHANTENGEWRWPHAQGFFSNPREGERYWPSDFELIKSGEEERLIFFLRRFRTINEGPPGFRFELLGTDAAIVSNPEAPVSEWRMDIHPMNEDKFSNLGAAVAQRGDYLYSFEEVRKPEGGHQFNLARINVADIIRGSTEVSYFHSDAKTWKNERPQEPLLPFGAPEASLKYDRSRQHWRTVYQPEMSGPVLMRTAGSLTDEWSEPVAIYEPSAELKAISAYSYAGKEVDLGRSKRAGEIDIGICSNAPQSLEEPASYIPRIVTVDIGRDRHKSEHSQCR